MPTGSNGSGYDGSILLGCEGRSGHLANPASADGEDGFFPLSSPLQLFMKALMNLVMVQDVDSHGLMVSAVTWMIGS